MATSLLTREEANLLHAFDLARRNGWSHEMVRVMQGLEVLFRSTGRGAEWARLVDQVTVELTDPVTGSPRQGQEWDWVLLTEYRVDLAVEARDWETAMRLQRARVAWNREQVAELLTLHPVRLGFEQRGLVRTLAAAMHTLGRILSELDDPGCVEAYAEALELYARTNDRRGQALSTINLGNAYRSIPSIRDLDKAEDYYRRTLDLCGRRDPITRSQAMNGLGNVHQERLDAAADAGRPLAELLVHLNAAARAYRQALGLLPADAPHQRAVVRNQLGLVYALGTEWDEAMDSYREAIHLFEAGGERFYAAGTRRNVASMLLTRGRVGEAQLWAQAALADYEAVGPSAAGELARTKEMLATMEGA
jgi:tetratricopeptide (TPR) repeat protein